MAEEWSEAAKRQAQIIGAAMEAAAEAKRALDKHGPKNTMDAPDKTDGERLAILVEEVGEVAKELTYDHAGVVYTTSGDVWAYGALTWESWGSGEIHVVNGQDRERVETMTAERMSELGITRSTQQDRLRKELIQTAAMALTWAAML